MQSATRQQISGTQLLYGLVLCVSMHSFSMALLSWFFPAATHTSSSNHCKVPQGTIHNKCFKLFISESSISSFSCSIKNGTTSFQAPNHLGALSERHLSEKLNLIFFEMMMTNITEQGQMSLLNIPYLTY